MKPNQTCERCHQPTWSTIMSMFNTEMICSECKTKERKHPRFDEASRAELESVQRGERNFPGIGKPDDL